MPRWSIFIGLFIVGAMCAAAWFLAPKGENQVSVDVHICFRGRDGGGALRSSRDAIRY